MHVLNINNDIIIDCVGECLSGSEKKLSPWRRFPLHTTNEYFYINLPHHQKEGCATAPQHKHPPLNCILDLKYWETNNWCGRNGGRTGTSPLITN